MSISLERFLSSVPATAFTLDDQSMVRVREIDAAFDRAEPVGSHLAEWWWEAGFPQECLESSFEFTLRNAKATRHRFQDRPHGRCTRPSSSADFHEYRSDFVERHDSPNDRVLDESSQGSRPNRIYHIKNRPGRTRSRQGIDGDDMMRCEVGRFVDDHTGKSVRETMLNRHGGQAGWFDDQAMHLRR